MKLYKYIFNTIIVIIVAVESDVEVVVTYTYTTSSAIADTANTSITAMFSATALDGADSITVEYLPQDPFRLYDPAPILRE